ncbi:MAG: cupin domain-containing protein [Polyangiaceae bacterium]|nr:cupin domain-containing protein [Polyangiaceae bacterium]
MTTDGVFDITKNPIHLGLGAKVKVQPDFTGAMDWYMAYGARNAADGTEGRLVTIHSFSASWSMWEMHPKGDELVVCLKGRITLHQEIDGNVRTVTLEPNQGVINPPGAWHTADVDGEATALFITAGEGTEHRPR